MCQRPQQWWEMKGGAFLPLAHKHIHNQNDSWHTQDLADSPQAEISTKCAVIPHWTGSRSSPVYVTMLCKVFNNTFTFNLLHIQSSLSFPDPCSTHLSFPCVKITFSPKKPELMKTNINLTHCYFGHNILCFDNRMEDC